MRVEDSLGCEATGEIEVIEPDLLILAIDSIRDAGDFENGAAWLSAIGGRLPYNTVGISCRGLTGRKR